MIKIPESAKYVTCRFCGSRCRKVRGSSLYRCINRICHAFHNPASQRMIEGTAHQFGDRYNG